MSQRQDGETPSQRFSGAERSRRERQGQVPALFDGVELFQLPRHCDERGTLIVSQFTQDLPFQPVRFFQVLDVGPGVTRGDHAHLRCHLFMIATVGSAKVGIDNSTEVVHVTLDSPDVGLYIPPLIWSFQFDFKPGSRLLICASEFYDESDYIDDYDEFKRLVAGARS